MDQAFNTGFQLHKGAVIGDVGHAAREFRGNRVFERHTIPRIGHQLLHAKADALRILIEADHLHLHRHADGQCFGWVVDAPPGDVGDMQQAIHAAEVHEGAVIGDVLHDTIQDHAFLEALDQLAPLFGAGFFQNGAAGDNDIAPRAIHFQDLEGLRIAHQRHHITHRADIHLRARQEGNRPAKIHGEATLHTAEDHAIHANAGLVGFFESRPGFLAPRLLARQHDGTIAIFITLDEKLINIAGLHFGLLARGGKFLERDAAFAFQADI